MDSTNYQGVKIETFEFWEQTQKWGLNWRRLEGREKESEQDGEAALTQLGTRRGWAHSEGLPDTSWDPGEALGYQGAWAEALVLGHSAGKDQQTDPIRTPALGPQGIKLDRKLWEP